MTSLHGQVPADVDRISSPQQRAPAKSSSATRWGPWLVCVLVAAAAILTVAINGSVDASTQVPSVIQVGTQTRTSPAHVTTTTHAAPSLSTTTILVAKHPTTVVRPQATVTDHEGTSGGENSNDTTAAATSTGNP
jgi:hypothetical protein